VRRLSQRGLQATSRVTAPSNVPIVCVAVGSEPEPFLLQVSMARRGGVGRLSEKMEQPAARSDSELTSRSAGESSCGLSKSTENCISKRPRSTEGVFVHVCVENFQIGGPRWTKTRKPGQFSVKSPVRAFSATIFSEIPQKISAQNSCAYYDFGRWSAVSGA